MKNKIYKVNGNFIAANDSTEAINKLRETGEHRKIDCKFICDTQKIIPTVEDGKMILFEVTDNKVTEFITANSASVSLEKFYQNHKSVTSFTKVICFIEDLI